MLDRDTLKDIVVLSFLLLQRLFFSWHFLTSDPPTETLFFNIRKGMRLCAHVRLYWGIAKHLYGNGVVGNISHAWRYATDIAYTIKRKHKCSILPCIFWRNFNKGTLSQCFSCLRFLSLESECKNTKKFQTSKINFQNSFFNPPPAIPAWLQNRMQKYNLRVQQDILSTSSLPLLYLFSTSSLPKK